MGRLTKALVENTRPRAGRVYLWDDVLPGFGAVVHPSGRRVYVVQYRNAAGRTRRLTVGRHGVLTIDQARKIGAERLVAATAGRDPAEERRAEREQADAPSTLADMAARWLDFQRARAEKGKLRARTLAEYERQLGHDVLPRLGRRRLAELVPADAQALHDALATTPALANRVIDLLSAVWRWGESRGLVSGPNPCRRVERNEEARRTRHLTHEELGRLGAELERLVSARKVPPRVAALVRLIALTGCRPGEIKSLAWADADLGRNVLRLRDAKTGDRDVWLAEPAAKELERVRALPLRPPRRGSKRPDRQDVAGRFVFPSVRDFAKPVREFRKPWAALLKAAKLEHMEPYVLRHTFASESEALGHSPYLTAELLGHSAGRRDMTRGYVHHIPDDVRRASERVAASIAAALAGGAAGAGHEAAPRG